MKMERRTAVRRLALVAVLTLGVTAARAGDDGLVLHANGWYQGKSDISDQQIKCEVPTVTSAISDGAHAMGIWNTYGVQTLFFPDTSNGFANPCGGWLQLQNNSLYEGLTLDVVKLKMRIQGARRWRQLVPTRAGLPSACAAMRRTPLFAGLRLDPYQSPPHSNSGSSNVVFFQAVPMVRTELIHCLRSQYNDLDTAVFTDFPLVIEATAYATSDSGSRYRSNTVRYTLNLRHTCGNGRADDGEECDPGNTDTAICNGGICKDGECSLAKGVPCADASDCVGSCLARGGVNECTCAY